MKLSKKIMVAAAAGALGVAAATPAMALENEFHGMYRVYGFVTNAFSGGTTFQAEPRTGTDKYIEQRARLMYIAKASDDLKLVTHFELDTKFGGSSGTKYPIGDAGGLDADRITLETKQVYLDFKIPSTKVNVKVGIQPWADSMQFIYGNFDAPGVVATTKMGALTAQYGYFTVGNNNGSFAYDNAPAATLASGLTFDSNSGTKDLNVLELKYDINKNLTVGASYYLLLAKAANDATYSNNTIGLNATGKFGPATVTANAAIQLGNSNTNLAISSSAGTTAYAGSLAAKIAAGPGAINAAALYLSGDNGSGYNRGWQSLHGNVNFYVPSNTYLLIRNLDTINTSSAIGGGLDLTRGTRGMLGVFAGYAGEAGKVLYAANVAAAKVADKRTAASANIGAELNAMIGYKIYSNLKADLTAAYAILGDGYGKQTGTLIGGVNGADNPYMLRAALNYAF